MTKHSANASGPRACEYGVSLSSQRVLERDDDGCGLRPDWTTRIAASRAPDLRQEAIWRAVEANRATYSGDQLLELERALAEARQLKSCLLAFETSTIWRLTKPIRDVVEFARALRKAPSKPAHLPSAPCRAYDPLSELGYQNWIASEEAAILGALLQSGTRYTPVTAPRLGFVLWTEQVEGGTVAKYLAATLSRIPDTCSILVICPAPALEAARQAAAACGRHDAMFEAADAGRVSLPVALERLSADYLCFHHVADRIAPQALDVVHAVLSEQPQTALLFADEDWIGPDGNRTRPFFKPDWDVELQRGQDLVGPFAFYATTQLHAVAPHDLGGPAWRYQLATLIAAAVPPEHIQHVPAILCHRVTPPPPGHAAAMREHAETSLWAQGIDAEVQTLEGSHTWQRVVYAVPQPEPLVSVIIPTRDRPDLLRTCTDGLLNQTDYRRVELLIVDNGTEDAEALALIETLARDARVRVLRRPGPFNWSALNNDGARRAGGEILLLLNNDIAVLQKDWLSIIVAQALQPGVGAVGAKLLYPDGRVQHAGITTDKRGNPRHLLRFARADDPGPYGMLTLAHSVWSVTGACLAVRRDLFFQVGGLNEGLRVTCNDVELCLRLAAHGYRTVLTPAAVLEHRELASRGPDHAGPRLEQAREELNRLRRDWGSLALHDPYLTPHFDLTEEYLPLRHV